MTSIMLILIKFSRFPDFPQEQRPVLLSDRGQVPTILTEDTKIDLVEMLDIELVVLDLLFLLASDNGILKDPDTAHFVGGYNRVVHDLSNF